MSNNNGWSANGENIPVVQPHTKIKHLLLEQYVTDLIDTLHSSGRYGVQTFTFIDGFCGGGVYLDEENKTHWYGSPIRLINAVRAGHEKSQRKYSEPINIKFIFIDEKIEHLQCLKNFAMTQAGLENLTDSEEHIFNSSFDHQRIEQCEFICGEFEKHINECVLKASLRKGHSLFFLDPYGWSDIYLESFRKINSLNKSEIIYTFMTDFIKRFVFAKDGKERETFKKIFETEPEGYFNNQQLKNLDQFGEQSFYRNELMRLLRNKGGAKRITTFALINKIDDRVLYYLVHISGHTKAIEVMKEGSWVYNNLKYQFHYDIYGYGFRTSEYFQKNQMEIKFDINQDPDDFCRGRLIKQILDEIVENYNDGITFKEICNLTLETNPATRSHYEQSLNYLRENKDIDILDRNGKKTQRSQLQNTDIIKKSTSKQLFIPGLEW